MPQLDVAGGHGHAVPDHVAQHHRIDVAAGEHGDRRRREPPRVLQQRGHRGRARRLDEQLRPLQAVQQRPRQRVVVHGEDLVDEGGDLRERHVARPADRDAVGEGAHHRQRRRRAARPATAATRPRPRPARPTTRTPSGTRRGDAAEQAAAPGRDQHRRHVRALLDDLEPDGALAGDHVDVVERVHEHRAGALGERARLRRGSRRSSRRPGARSRRSRGWRRPWAAPPAPA